ncbi:MAG: NAD-dependent epimerase/dehydratase family protein [Candidatus Didemnitutus sp.]|nr:NAD-dependent epimerase/dehydratase family protein [Candidatus Didemnitutus sp.]
MINALQDKRLVIFGCGYVGAALATAARTQGARVIALTRNPAKAAALAAQGIDVVVDDLAGSSWHAKIAAGADYVVNTVSAAGPNPAGYRQSYVEGMRSILAWVAQGAKPVATLIYTSSTGVYAQGGGVVVTEETTTEGASITGRILVEAENLLRSAPATLVQRSFILRLAGIYGPGRHYLLNALRTGSAPFAGNPALHQNLAHRDDFVSALLACLSAPASIGSEVFNISDDAPATKAELLGWLAEQLQVAAPTFASEAAADPSRRGGEATPDRIIQSGKIRRVLGWAPAYSDFRAGYTEILRQL